MLHNSLRKELGYDNKREEQTEAPFSLSSSALVLSLIYTGCKRKMWTYPVFFKGKQHPEVI